GLRCGDRPGRGGSRGPGGAGRVRTRRGRGRRARGGGRNAEAEAGEGALPARGLGGGDGTRRRAPRGGGAGPGGVRPAAPPGWLRDMAGTAKTKSIQPTGPAKPPPTDADRAALLRSGDLDKLEQAGINQAQTPDQLAARGEFRWLSYLQRQRLNNAPPKAD